MMRCERLPILLTCSSGEWCHAAACFQECAFPGCFWLGLAKRLGWPQSNRFTWCTSFRSFSSFRSLHRICRKWRGASAWCFGGFLPGQKSSDTSVAIILGREGRQPSGSACPKGAEDRNCIQHASTFWIPSTLEFAWICNPFVAASPRPSGTTLTVSFVSRLQAIIQRHHSPPDSQAPGCNWTLSLWFVLVTTCTDSSIFIQNRYQLQWKAPENAPLGSTWFEAGACHGFQARPAEWSASVLRIFKWSANVCNGTQIGTAWCSHLPCVAMTVHTLIWILSIRFYVMCLRDRHVAKPAASAVQYVPCSVVCRQSTSEAISECPSQYNTPK